MNRWLGAILIFVALGGLFLRVHQLDARPMHNDEAVNSVKVNALWSQREYRYDPDEYHGPTLYYLSLPTLWFSGARDFSQITETTLRLTPALFGAGMILLVWLLSDGLGRSGTVFAGVFLALSPAMVFYSRYYIHEMLLAFFILLFLAAGWRYYRARRLGWAMLLGAATGLMYATKETSPIPVVCAATAAALTALVFQDHPATSGMLDRLKAAWSAVCAQWNWRHLGAALLCGVMVASLFLTSFYGNPGGMIDSLRSYMPWANRAAGASPHIHPWYFYFERLLWFHRGRGPVWTEALILILAILGLVLRRPDTRREQRILACFLGCYTLLQATAYSLIPYKTPWCLVGFWTGCVVLAGMGASLALQWSSRRWVNAGVAAALVLGFGHLAWETWQTSFVEPAHPRNPYVYAQTSPDILELVDKVKAIAAAQPEGTKVLVKVMAKDRDYWPLPWYLRIFPNIGWWDAVPADPLAAIIIADARLHPVLDPLVEKTHTNTGFFSLTPRVFLELVVQEAVWQRYMESKAKPLP
jgi:uncharacterized protein (TIGR03663 family)